jgi:Acetyltransferase (GNAT) domain
MTGNAKFSEMPLDDDAWRLWDEIVLSQNHPFNISTYRKTWQKWFGSSGARLVWQQGVFAAVVEHGTSGFSPYPARTMACACNDHCVYSALVVAPQREAAAADGLLSGLAAHRRRTETLRIGGLMDGPFKSALEEAAGARGMIFRSDHEFVHYGLDRDERGGTFVSGLSKQASRTLRKQTNRLEALGNLELAVWTGSQAVEKFTHYIEVENQGWKPDSGEALSRNFAAGSFYLDLLKGFGTAWDARLYLLTLDNASIAALLCIGAGRFGVTYKIAHAGSFDRYSPGRVLLQKAFVDFANAGYSHIDCYSGAPLIASYRPTPFRFSNISIWNNTLRARALASAQSVLRLARRSRTGGR